ncbi:LRR receptor-like kinase [Medicago truncatula]|uniref:LRR receptor-like kinase n=1 Tax=Medicago truncatula TaxID=3880 RepID=G7IZX9_MEDTR|nr:LRR receptor-like kinase [Medicago truncatula]
MMTILTSQMSLLFFKWGINDSLGQISTWSTEKNCCVWEGVYCDNISRRVTKLESLFNDFDMIRIPSIQHNITHSSKLVYLDLSYSFVTGMDNLDWLSPLSSLKYLNLSGIDLHKETNWLQIVNTLPSLLELQLSSCNLNNLMINPYIKYLNLSSIVTLDLSLNNFTSHLPDRFFNLTYLTFHRKSRYLDLFHNQLQGSVPEEIGQLARIYSFNSRNLSSLIYLSIGSNNFSGEISNLHFSKLSSLVVPPFRLTYLSLRNTNQGPNFPSWIYTQKSLQHLDISSLGISLVDRNKFSSLIERIPSEIILSNNWIAEDISNLTLNCSYIRLDHNNFTGGLPNISWKNLKELTFLNLWSNRLSGEVSLNLSIWKQLKVHIKLSFLLPCFRC